MWTKTLNQSMSDLCDVRVSKRAGVWFLSATIPGPEGAERREVRVGTVLTAAEKTAMVDAVKKCVATIMADCGWTET